MGLVPSELSLDLRPTFVPKTINDFFCQLSTIKSATYKLSMLDDFIARLELELTKIDAFKRELPLCMLLLNDAISALKVESAKCRGHKSELFLEEFIPLKKECDDDFLKKEASEKEKECKEKKNWMSSVQLWNNTTTATTANNAHGYDKKQNYKLENKQKNEEEKQFVAEDCLFQYGGNRNGGKGFIIPFSNNSTTKEEKEDSVVNETGMKNSKEGSGSIGYRTNSNRVVSSSYQQKTTRKQRRCWSQELHYRFVKALEELGGSQAATPKQIRALMRVDGLTNDEVKSHLQKYRLHHTRRVQPATAATANQSVVVLGRLWMYSDSSKGSISGSGSPQGPFHLTTRSGEGTSPTKGDKMKDDEDIKVYMGGV